MSWLAGAVVGVVLLVSGALKAASPQWPGQAAELGAPRLAVPTVPAAELETQGYGQYAGLFPALATNDNGTTTQEGHHS